MENILLISALALCCLPPVALALECVVCNSYMDGENCANWDTLSFIQECPPDENKFCAKIEQFTEGAVRIVRKCSNAETVPGCIRRIGSDNKEIRQCHCNTTLCNPASQNLINYVLIVSIIILFSDMFLKL
nr:hypothetical transcript [Hymenolepis microstoma]